ncbi:MAG: hypothetical protein WB992_19755 [Bryobacteraceae bacterium]
MRLRLSIAKPRAISTYPDAETVPVREEPQGKSVGRSSTDTALPAFERHYSPKELAELWNLNECTIRRMFIDEPDVFVYGKENRRDGRRDYVTLRIPASVAARVHGRLLRKPGRLR